MSICLPSCVSWESWGVCRTCRTLCRCRACQKCARACAFSCRYCWRSVCRSHRTHTWTVSLLPKKKTSYRLLQTMLMFPNTAQCFFFSWSSSWIMGTHSIFKGFYSYFLKRNRPSLYVALEIFCTTHFPFKTQQWTSLQKADTYQTFVTFWNAQSPKT